MKKSSVGDSNVSVKLLLINSTLNLVLNIKEDIKVLYHLIAQSSYVQFCSSLHCYVSKPP